MNNKTFTNKLDIAEQFKPGKHLGQEIIKVRE